MTDAYVINSRITKLRRAILSEMLMTSQRRFMFYLRWCVPAYNQDEIVELVENEGYTGA